MRGYHRIRVEGVTAAADRLREYLHRAGYTLVPDPKAALWVELSDGDELVLDTRPGLLETRLLVNLEELDAPDVRLQRRGGNRDERGARITVPGGASDIVALAVFRAIDQVSNQTQVPERPIVSAPAQSRPWWRFWATATLLLVANVAFGQTNPPFQQLDANTGSVTNERVFVGLFAPSASGAVAVPLPTALGASGGFQVEFPAGSTIGITGTVAVTQSGTWTVQPGNTANTTAWLVTGTGGTFPATQSGTWTVQPGNTANTTAWLVSPQAIATGGATPLSYISVGSTEDEHAVCTSACTLYSVAATNTNAAVRYLKCENDTAANTAPGTDTPEFRLGIPGDTTGAGFIMQFPVGVAFGTALTCWLVTGAADSDVAEVAANELMVFYSYK